MMLTRQAVFGRIRQDPAQHPAQRIARQHVISDVIGRHGDPVASKIAGEARRMIRLARFAPMLPRREPEISRADG
ncbi:hypothetical protein JCM18382A_01020 [Bradyrhizobium sp. 17-4]